MTTSLEWLLKRSCCLKNAASSHLILNKGFDDTIYYINNIILYILLFLLDDMLSKYRDRSGFVIQSPISSIQYKGNIEKLRDYVQKMELPQVKVEPLNYNHLHEVAQLHKKAGGHFGIEYWKEWMQLQSPKSFVALDDSGNVNGFISAAPDSKNGVRNVQNRYLA